jgi:hypothetical protein
MTRRTHFFWISAMTVALTLGAARLWASDPIGVYAMVDRITVSHAPNGDSTAQIWGAFAVATPPPAGSYTPEQAYTKARRGYLLIGCPAAQAATCRAEWNDLQSLAGTGDVAGFGARWNGTPRVRNADEVPGAPDPFRANVGVVRIGRYGDYPTIVAALQAARGAK